MLRFCKQSDPNELDKTYSKRTNASIRWSPEDQITLMRSPYEDKITPAEADQTISINEGAAIARFQT